MEGPCEICGEEHPSPQHRVNPGHYLPDYCRVEGCREEAEVCCALEGGGFVLRCACGHVTRIRVEG